MQPAVAKNEYVLVTTSSPAPMFSAIMAASSASVPDDTPTASFTSSIAASSRSRPSTSGPMMNRWLSQTRVMAASTSSRIGRYWAWRSSSGTEVTCDDIRRSSGGQQLRGANGTLRRLGFAKGSREPAPLPR